VYPLHAINVESAKSDAMSRNLDVAIVSREAMNALLLIPMIPPEKSIDAGPTISLKQKNFEWKGVSVLVSLKLDFGFIFAIER
jgi:hypothetical protein